MLYYQIVIISFLVHVCIDRVLEYMLQYKNQTTYYIVHLLFNLAVCIASFQPLIYIMSDFSKLADYSSMPLSASIIGMFMYHIIVYWKFLKFDDWFHHGFATVYLINTIFYDFDFNGVNYVLSFFMTGLPGIFYYGPLVCLKNGWITKKTEITIQYYIGTYLRAPGINFATWAMLIYYARGDYIINTDYIILFYINIGINLLNAQYFNSLSTIGYARHILLKRE